MRWEAICRGSNAALDWAWPGHPRRWRDVPRRLRPTLGMVSRLTAAAVIAYLVTSSLTEQSVLTGPLTAVLVVQASAYQTFKVGAVRVTAVVAGVLVAVAVSTGAGLTWWSLGLVVGLSLLVAKALRLGDQALEMPISAMLILGVSDYGLAAETRVQITLIGAVVGLAIELAMPPALPSSPAIRDVRRVARESAAPLAAAARALQHGPVSRHQVDGWVDQVRRASDQLEAARCSAARLRDTRRFNPRALGTPDVDPVLVSGLETFEHCQQALRALLAAIRAEVPDDHPVQRYDDPYGAELRQAFALVLGETARSLRAFGDLVIAEVDQDDGHAHGQIERAMSRSHDLLGETRAILAELVMLDADSGRHAWLLRASVLTALRQLLEQLDVEERNRAHRAWKAEQARAGERLPVMVRAMLPHPDLLLPRAAVELITDPPRRAQRGSLRPAGGHRRWHRPASASRTASCATDSTAPVQVSRVHESEATLSGARRG